MTKCAFDRWVNKIQLGNVPAGDHTPDTPCWEWTASLKEQGYGAFQYFVNGKYKSFSHTFSYHFFTGHDPEGLHVRHLCHNRKCCNPDHLITGTAKENRDDSIEAGKSFRGEQNSNCKLTQPQANQIRALYDEAELSMSDIAKLCNVPLHQVDNIGRRKSWPDGTNAPFKQRPRCSSRPQETLRRIWAVPQLPPPG